MLNYRKIKELCKERNISITFLEKSLGFGKGTIGKWRESSPKLKNAELIANFFNVPLDELLVGKEKC